MPTMATIAPAGLADMKQRTRAAWAAWAAGDFPAVAGTQLLEVGPRLVQRVGIGAGEDVLDVACGAVGSAFGSAADAVDFAVRTFVPLIMLRPKLEAEGTWSELLTRIAVIYDRREPAEYLVTVGRTS